MTLTQKSLLALLITGIIVTSALLFAFSYSNLVTASAPSGLPATVASSSAPRVTSTQSLVIATSSCSARIISTATSSVRITFSDIQGAVPTDDRGHWQGASTTVAYDSGLYGCDAVRVWSQSAQIIEVSDVR